MRSSTKFEKKKIVKYLKNKRTKFFKNIHRVVYEVRTEEFDVPVVRVAEIRRVQKVLDVVSRVLIDSDVVGGALHHLDLLAGEIRKPLFHDLSH